MKPALQNVPIKFGGHSASVDMSLHTGGRILPVVQSAGNAIKLKTEENLAEGLAVLEIVVDGRVHRHEVRILPKSDKEWPGWIPISSS